MTGTKLRVYLVDDCLVTRIALEDLLVSEGFEVVGTAASGATALRQIPTLRPDVVVMDVLMPEMDGLECTRRLMASHATPILIVSDLVESRTDLNFKALKAGALDLCRKPTRTQLDDPVARARFARLVRLVAEVPVITRRAPSGPGSVETQATVRSDGASDIEAAPSPEAVWGPTRAPKALFIGASTGGPMALRDLLADLHQAGRAGPPIVIVQHMTPGFLAGLTGWLSQAMGLEVELVTHGLRLRPGLVALAPDHQNVELCGGHLVLVEPGSKGPRPSVDVLFHSVARQPGAERSCALLLTGMGRDGARGLEELARVGAWTIAQDEASSIVWGMPGTAVKLGAAREVLPLARIRARVHHWWSEPGRHRPPLDA